MHHRTASGDLPCFFFNALDLIHDVWFCGNTFSSKIEEWLNVIDMVKMLILSSFGTTSEKNGVFFGSTSLFIL